MSDPIDLARHIQQLEEQLLTPAVRSNADRLVALLAEDFREFGSSGHTYNRREIIEQLASEAAQNYPGEEISEPTLTLTDFELQLLAPDLALATYRSQRRAQTTGETSNSLRSSLWINRTTDQNPEGCWQILFHQGTPISTH